MSTDSQGPDGADKAPLRVWCADPAAAAPLCAALAARYVPDLLETLPGPPVTGAGDLLLLYAAPDVALARAMAAGTRPGQALADWREAAGALLRLNRSDRRRVRLADLDAARADPAGFAGLFDLPAPEAEPGTGTDAEPDTGAGTDPDTGQPDGILLLLAQHLLQGDAGTRALAAELAAAALDLGRPADDPAGAAFQAYHALHRSRQEAAILRRQSRSLQDEMAALETTRAALEADRDLAGDTARQTQMQVDLLKAQNRAMQTELETLAQRRQQLEARLEQLNHGIDSYQSQVAALTGETETLKTRMAGKEHSLQAAGRLVEERDAHVARLKDDLARSRTAESAGRERAGALQGALAEARQQAETLGTDLAASRQQAETLAREMAAITSSRSFRLTAPLRRMRALLGRRP